VTLADRQLRVEKRGVGKPRRPGQHLTVAVEVLVTMPNI
jgi:hypothetical protein